MFQLKYMSINRLSCILITDGAKFKLYKTLSQVQAYLITQSSIICFHAVLSFYSLYLLDNLTSYFRTYVVFISFIVAISQNGDLTVDVSTQSSTYIKTSTNEEKFQYQRWVNLMLNFNVPWTMNLSNIKVTKWDSKGSHS